MASDPAQSPSMAVRVPTHNGVPSEKPVSDNSPTTESDSNGEPVFVEGGYGWVVVISVLLVNAHTWGLNAAYSIFLAYYLRSGSFDGASPLAFAFVGGLSISIALLVSPLATVSIAKLGTQTTLRIGVVFEAISFVGASFASQMWHLLLSQGLAFGLGMGFLFTATVGLVPQWFVRRRSFANAVSTAGSGLGGLVYSLGANAMIANLGLAWAFRILAILAFLVNGICSFTLRDRNKAVGAVHVAFHPGVLVRPEFWLFVSWGFFSVLGYIIVIFSLADYCQNVGLSAQQASIVAAMFNLSQGVGRPFIGLVSDKIGRINVAGLGTLIASVAAFFLWIFAGRFYAGAIVYSLFGMFAGILWATIAPVCAEVIGVQLLPAALSICWLILVLPSTFAEVIGLSLRKDEPDGYINVQIFSGFVYLLAFVLLWILRSWKLREMDLLGLTAERNTAEGVSDRQENVAMSYVKGLFLMEKV